MIEESYIGIARFENVRTTMRKNDLGHISTRFGVSPENLIVNNNIKTLELTSNCIGCQYAIQYNNFIQLHPNQILFKIAESSAVNTFLASQNYWGYFITLEMEDLGKKANISVIYDVFDDFDLPEISYAPWLHLPIADAGPSWTPGYYY